MKRTKLKKTEWIYLVPLLAQWVVYLLLLNKLPAKIATHFTIEDGKWVPNDYTAPFWLMVIMTIVYGVVYVSLNRRYASSTKLFFFFPVLKAVVLVFLSLLNTKLLWDGAHPGTGFSQGSYKEFMVLLIVLNAFVFYVFRFQMGNENERPLSNTYFHLLWALMHLLITLTVGIPLLSLAGIHLLDGKGMTLIILTFLAVTGNITYNVKPNSFVGIRLPWTLNNEQVWRKTHHMAGIMLLLASVGGIIATWTLPAESHFHAYVIPGVVVIGTIIPAIYSFFIYRQQKTNNYTV